MFDEKTIQDLKNKLIQEKNKLETALARIARKSEGNYEAEFEDFGRDEEDNAEEVEEYAMKVGITETFEKKLEDINLALKKIEDGTYGICENCPNEEIPLERLMVYPSARTCLKCSEK